MRAQRASDLAKVLAQIESDLGAIRRALRRPFEEAVARGGLTVPQTAVMQAVYRHGGISLKDLSRAVSLAHSTVSGIVDRLERNGLLKRRADLADGRVSRIHVTAPVARFVRHTMPALHRGPLGRALEKASAQERAQIARALARLRALLQEVQGGA